jgi:hypothetical protein
MENHPPEIPASFDLREGYGCQTPASSPSPLVDPSALFIGTMSCFYQLDPFGGCDANHSVAQSGKKGVWMRGEELIAMKEMG